MRTSTPRKVRSRRTAFEAAQKVGLIGCFDGPCDLAQNRKKYLLVAVLIARIAGGK